MRSGTIGELAKALSTLQGKLTPVKRDATNPFFHSKYADLASVWDGCHQLLAENGLAVTQTTRLDGEQIVLVTTLLHLSGEWLEGEYPVRPVKADPQGLGSALTYARRYGLCAILGVTAEGEDDDAEEATQRPGPQEKRAKPARPTTVTTAPVVPAAPEEAEPLPVPTRAHYCTRHSRSFGQRQGRDGSKWWSHPVDGTSPQQWCNEEQP